MSDKNFRKTEKQEAKPQQFPSNIDNLKLSHKLWKFAKRACISSTR